MEEYEVKFLDIDKEVIIKRIIDLGGVFKYDKVFVDKVFDYPDFRLDSKGAWVRLRDKGERITLSYKQRLGMKTGEMDKGMIETEVEVSDFEKTSEIFLQMGMEIKFYEEKRCISYVIDGVEVNIDERPLIPAYLEVEGKSWEEVENMVKKLGLDWDKKVIFSAMQVYKTYGVDEKAYQILTFKEQIKRDEQK